LVINRYKLTTFNIWLQDFEGVRGSKKHEISKYFGPETNPVCLCKQIIGAMATYNVTFGYHIMIKIVNS